MSNSTSHVTTITGALIGNPKKIVIEGKKGKQTIWYLSFAKDAKDGGRKGEEKGEAKATYWFNVTFRGDHDILEKAKKGTVLTVTCTKPYLMDEYSYSPYSFNSEKGYASASEKLDAFGVTYGSYVTKKEGDIKTSVEKEELKDINEPYFPEDDELILSSQDKKMDERMKQMPLGVEGEELELLS